MEQKESNPRLFSIAKPGLSYLKVGILGEPASGKTTTAAYLMFGVHKFVKSKKPIFFVDTEDGSDWIIGPAKTNGIELHTFKTRAFVDLCAAVQEAEKHAGALIIDSISHFWLELMASYLAEKKRKTGRSSMGPRDWGILKPQWAEFTKLYLKAKTHIAICGRAQEVFEETGKDDIRVKDVRLQAGKELGYEPSLLIEMIRITDLRGSKDGEPKRVTKREAVVRKDRDSSPTSLDGKRFIFTRQQMEKMDKKNVIFEAFASHIKKLNLGGEQRSVSDKTSSELFDEGSENAQVSAAFRGYAKAVEELKAEFQRYIPGRKAQDVKLTKELLAVIFGTPSWKVATDLEDDDPAEKTADLREKTGLLHTVFILFETKEPAQAEASRLDIVGLVNEAQEVKAKGGPGFGEVRDAAQAEAVQVPSDDDLPF